MADIDTSSDSGHGGKHGGVRSKKMSTRVDLTPMVDLAFLLISFFMLTTTLNKPKAMQLIMPKKPQDTAQLQKVTACQVMTLLIDSTDKVWYYYGLSTDMENSLNKVPYEGKTEKEGIRPIISEKLRSVHDGNDCSGEKPLDNGEKRNAIVLIKVLKGAKYRHMVDLLDDMDITQAKVFAIQDPDSTEIATVANSPIK